MSTTIFELDDTVWAKMKNYAPWPALIADPRTATVKRPGYKNQVYYWIFFFGTNNFAWIDESKIQPYHQYKEQILAKYLPSKVSQYKKKSFSEAVDEMDNYLLAKSNNPEHRPYRMKIVQLDSNDERSVSPPKQTNKRKLPRDKFLESKLAGKKLRVNLEIQPIDPTLFSTRPNNSVSSTVENHVSDCGNSVPDTPVIPSVSDLQKKSNPLNKKNVVAVKKKIGFLGVGQMGSAMVRNLKHSGHYVIIWDRNNEKCAEFERDLKVKVASTPADLVEKADIIFSCLSDSRVSRDIVYRNDGMKESFNDKKSLVELSSMNLEVSLDISEPLLQVGGRYLEAQVQGDLKMASDGILIFITAGNKSLFYDVQSCFKAMGAYSYYLGSNIGEACVMNLAIQTLKATSLAALAEAMSIVDRFKLKFDDLFEILDRTQLSSKFLKVNQKAISNKKYDNVLTLKYLQKDLRLLFELTEPTKQPLIIAANTNEVLKQAIRNGYGNLDASSMYEYIRH